MQILSFCIERHEQVTVEDHYTNKMLHVPTNHILEEEKSKKTSNNYFYYYETQGKSLILCFPLPPFPTTVVLFYNLASSWKPLQIIEQTLFGMFYTFMLRNALTGFLFSEIFSFSQHVVVSHAVRCAGLSHVSNTFLANSFLECNEACRDGG